MANSIAQWFLTRFPWAHISTESNCIKDNPELVKLKSECIGNDADEHSSRCSSPEEEIIRQMGKKYPTLFIT